MERTNIRQLNRLTAKTVAAARKPARYCDGGGLYLQVTTSGSKSWVFRYRSRLTGKLRDMGLGSTHSVTLADARGLAAAQRAVIANGQDPISAREETARQSALELTKAAAQAVTFSQCASAYIEAHKAGWKNTKHASQWTATLGTYAAPVIGTLPVEQVDTDLILRILEPIWTKKPETASRLRGRIENVLDWAKVQGYRSGENPALWKGNLRHLLPAISKKNRVKHHAAMPFPEVGQFVAKLRGIDSLSALCLEFTILTAARTGEAIQAAANEFDLESGVWTIPAARMKAGKEHQVPLSPRALEIAEKLLESNKDFLFPSTRGDKPLSNMAMLQLLERLKVDVTVHGFRSSFRDWAAECTDFSHEVCEMALAHTISNSAEAAYRRGNLFEKRRRLMEEWSGYIDATSEPNVVPMRQIKKTA